MKTKLLLLALLLGPITSQATPIRGGLVIHGTITLNNNNPALATEVISWDSVRLNRAPTGAFGFPRLNITTSDLTTPWIFDPSTPTMPFLQIGGFTFNLESIFNFSRINDPFFKGISLQATGDVTHAGFETTPLSEFSFFANRDLSRAHFQKNVNFRLFIGNPIVPDSGSTVCLFGVAVLLLVGIKRCANSL
jgi:hypothetical protein